MLQLLSLNYSLRHSHCAEKNLEHWTSIGSLFDVKIRLCGRIEHRAEKDNGRKKHQWCTVHSRFHRSKANAFWNSNFVSYILQNSRKKLWT